MMRTRSRDGIRPDIRTQNTPHEDYLVCHICEQYFSSIEREVANKFFKHFKVEDSTGFSIRVPMYPVSLGQGCDPAIFLLFVYSVLWRAQQTYCNEFWAINMEPEETDQLREVLYNCMSTRIVEMIDKFRMNYHTGVPFKFQIVIPHGVLDADDHVIVGATFNRGRYGLFAGRFFLGVVKSLEDQHAVNDGIRMIEIDSLDASHWRNFFTTQLDLLTDLNRKFNK